MNADTAGHQDEPLRAGELLAGIRLSGGAVRDGDSVDVTMSCGRPFLYPLAPADLPPKLSEREQAQGARYFGAVFAFDLDDPPAGYRYAAVRFTADLGDSGATAVLVHSGGDQLGLITGEAMSPIAGRAAEAVRPALLHRLGLRSDRPAAWTTGTLNSRFGWRYRDRRATPILPRTYGVHAVLEIPAGIAALTGTLEAEAELAGVVRRSMTAAAPTPFTLPLPGPVPARTAAVRLCVAADVVAYSGRTPAAAERVQHDLVEVLAEARAAAGIAAGAVDPQPQGDGQFTVLPVGLDEADVIPRLLRGLSRALSARNAAEPADRIRLRVALHRGLVKEADNGWVGRAAVAVHRILDSPPLRSMLTENPQADWVLGVPDALFADVLSTGDDPPPKAFRPATVDLPAKGFLEQVWLYVPGVAA
jgi:hypothetical protein